MSKNKWHLGLKHGAMLTPKLQCDHNLNFPMQSARLYSVRQLLNGKSVLHLVKKMKNWPFHPVQSQVVKKATLSLQKKPKFSLPLAMTAVIHCHSSTTLISVEDRL